MDSCSLFFSPLSPNYLEAKKQLAVRNMTALALGVLLFTVISIPVIHHFSPKSDLFNAYTGTTLSLGSALIVGYALISYFKWKKDRVEHEAKTVTLFGQKGFSRQKRLLLPERQITVIDDYKGDCHVFLLPNEVFKLIFNHLDLKSLFQLERTCRKFKVLLNDPKYWKFLVKRDFGESYLSQTDVKRQYGVLYSIKNKIFHVYKKETLQQIEKFFIFNNTIYFNNDDKLKDDKGVLIDPQLRFSHPGFYFSNLNDERVIAQHFSGSWFGIYDKNFQFKFALDFKEKGVKGIDSGEQVFAIKNCNAVFSKQLCFFDRKNLECLKWIEMEESINSHLIGHDKFYVSTDEGLFTYRLSDFSLIAKSSQKKVYHLESTSFFGENYLLGCQADEEKLLVFLESDLSEPVLSLPFNGGKRFFCHEQFLYMGFKGATWQVWDLSTQMKIKTFVFESRNREYCLFKPFLVIPSKGYVNLIDLRTHEILYSFENKGEVRQMDFLDDKLIILSDNRKVQEYTVIDFGLFK